MSNITIAGIIALQQLHGPHLVNIQIERVQDSAARDRGMGAKVLLEVLEVLLPILLRFKLEASERPK